MNLIKRNGRETLSSLRDQLFSPLETQFDKVFNDFYNGFFSPNSKTSLLSVGGYPKMDILEENGHWVVKANVSGTTPEDIEVEVLPENILQIKGKMSEEYQSSPDAVYHLRELKKSSFMRQVKLPDWTEGKDPQATIQDGILSLKWKLPEIEEPKQPETKKITVVKK